MGRIILALVIIAMLICVVGVWISYNWITVSYFEVSCGKIISPFRIVLISDLHDHRFGDNQEKLTAKIRKQSPDLIIMDGDMINRDSENADTAVNLVRILSETAPVCYSFGNHEYYYMEAGHTDLKKHLEEAQAVVPDRQIVDIEVKGNRIRLGGLYEYGFKTDMQSEEKNRQVISYLKKYVDTDRYLIMCAHRPESFFGEEGGARWGIDLVLSGHLHGGQVILPGIGGIYNTQEGFLPEYDFGHYRSGDGDIIITRGLGTNRKALPRFNNPPEIAVVDVLPE